MPIWQITSAEKLPIKQVKKRMDIISKSGTTTEPGIASRIFKKKLIEKYGKEEAAKRIYATTDRQREH